MELDDEIAQRIRKGARVNKVIMLTSRDEIGVVYQVALELDEHGLDPDYVEPSFPRVIVWSSHADFEAHREALRPGGPAFVRLAHEQERISAQLVAKFFPRQES